MKIKIIIPICLLLAFVVILGIYLRNYTMSKFPQKSDFALEASALKETLNSGEALEVKANFINLTNSDIKLGYGNLDGDTGIIMIHVVNSDNPNQAFLSDDIMKLLKLGAKQIITDNRKFKMDKPGDYIVEIAVNFNVYNSFGQIQKDPISITKNINIKVK